MESREVGEIITMLIGFAVEIRSGISPTHDREICMCVDKLFFCALVLFSLFPVCHAQSFRPVPDKWIDLETGHRVKKIAAIPYSAFPYFTANAISSDKKYAVFTSPRGIHLLKLDDFTSKLLVDGDGQSLWFIGAGRKENRIYYLTSQLGEKTAEIKSINTDGGGVVLHARLPKEYRVESLNADDNLAVGVSDDGDNDVAGSKKYSGKADALYKRFEEKRPMSLFTVDLKTGAIRKIYASTEWLSHPQFSPTNPDLLMYSLEGPWHLVDRIWLIRSDGTGRRLVHKRTMDMEIVGHEFWSADGTRIVYDWQYPKSATFFLAAFQVDTGRRMAFPLRREEWSLHYNSTGNRDVFIGDGGDKRQVAHSSEGAFLYLYRTTLKSTGLAESGLWESGTVRVEKLVDLRGNDYKLEPNVRITPDDKWVLFRSNMFGPPNIFAVEVKKSETTSEGRYSTYDLSQQAVQRYRQFMLTN